MTSLGKCSKESEENWGIFACIAVALYSTKRKVNIGMTTLVCTDSIPGFGAKKVEESF